MNKIKKFQGCAGSQRRLICLIVLLFSWLSGMGVLQAQQTIRVGYDSSGIYLYRDAAGTYRGYTVEYLYEIAKYTDWNYEFVPFAKWSGAIDALERGDIDLLPTVLKSPERQAKMLFSMRRMGDTYVALIVRKDDDVYFYGDLRPLQGAVIGVRQDTVDAEKFYDWARENQLQYNLRMFPDQRALLHALDTGGINAAAMSYTGRARGYRAVSEFASQEMYFAMPSGRRELMHKLDLAMGQIAVMNPDFLSKLTQKYMDNEMNPRPVFNEAERQFILGSDPVRVALLRNAFPFSYWDEDNGFQGIIPDLLHHFEQLSGLTFSLLPVDSQEEAFVMVQNGQAEIVGRLANNLLFAHANELRLTTPYAHLGMVRISRKDAAGDSIHRIAIQGSAQRDNLMSQETDADKEFTIYSDVEKCFEAFTSGEADAIYCDSTTASYFLNTHQASAYQVTALQGYSYDMTFGMAQRMDTPLAGILDKCIRYISAEDISALMTQDRLPHTRSWRAFIDRLPVRYLAAFVLGLTAIVMLLGYVSFSLWRKRGIENRTAAVREKNQQMQMELETAQKVNEVKEEFFSHISHDMRTPLNGILGFTNLAAEAESLSAAREYIDKIKLSGELLLALVNDTLQLSKLERGNLQLTWEPVDSMEFIEYVIAPICMFAKEKGITFHVDIGGWEKERVLMDRLNTHKVLLNILSNAVKFTDAGGSIYFSAESFKSSEGRFAAWITVRDTGIGITKEFLGKVYDPFTQEHAGTSMATGNGLGLSVAYRLIQLMGGNIEIKSQRGKGTEVDLEFYFELADHEQKECGPLEEKPDFTVLAGKKVLLCEDNALNTEIARTLLEQKEMRVVCAENGQQGIDIFSASVPYDFDLILMDLRMPVLDGYGAASGIRALDREDARHVPILALTADAYTEDVQKCLAHGMNAHIAKPIDPDVLFKEICRWLS